MYQKVKPLRLLILFHGPFRDCEEIQNPDPSKFKGVVTSDGKPVQFQMLSTGEMAFLAEDVPPLGSNIVSPDRQKCLVLK
jgi:hypothetical protein